jgi:alpha-glucosidase
LLPVYVKAGAVIPLQSVIQHTGQRPNHLLEWHIYPLHTGHSTYEHYEDDGISYDYKNGQYLKRKITLEPKSITFSATEGSYESPFTHYKLVFHHFEFDSVSDDSHTAVLHHETNSFIAELPNFNPIGHSAIVPIAKVKTIYVPASGQEFTLRFS